MNARLVGQLAAGCLMVSAIVSALVEFSPTNQSNAADPPAQKGDGFSPYVGKDGSISRPTEYREKFAFLGTYADSTKADKSIDEIHNVYAPLADVEAYRRDGKFPDGTVLVKEVCSADSDTLTTGQAHWVKDVKLWFVMIKDSKGRFPKNPLWGEGWGWALFKGDNPARNVATDFATDCKSCHIPAKKDDWVYIRGYPILKKQQIAH
jgi:Cytochrome P460